MSKKATKKATSKFTYIPKHDLPTLGKYPTTWDMKGLYYKSVNDPQIEKDIAVAEKAYAAFARKYKNSDFTSNVETLKRALIDSNKLDENTQIGKPTRYLALLTSLDSGNDAATKKLNLLSQQLTKATNQLLFFSLELAKVSKDQQKKFLTDEALVDFTYDLKQLFASAKHHLTEAEEKIIRQLSDVSYGMWVDAVEKMLGKRTIIYKGKKIPVNAAFATLPSLPMREQTGFWKSIMKEIDPLKEVVEHELTAVCTRKKISDELRDYKKPYSASVIGHEDDEKSVEALIEAVSTRGFALSKKFYKLKAALHKKDTLAYAERNASFGDTPVIDFAQATEICRDTFYGVNTKYGEIFDRLLINGQIDVYPAPGKRGGAFMSAETGQPTNVFLNHTDDISSVETYAHEMGHAIHSEMSKAQPAHYQDYSTTTAETASTLFEGLLFNAMLEQAPDDKKVGLLHGKISRDISTVQRQIAFHNFELEMHEIVRAQGAITHEELNVLMQKHLKSYCGPGVEITELDGNSYIYVSHFRYGFYVYTYTFGMLMSSQMADMFKADPAYAQKIDTFLTAGGSDTVTNIFKSIGFNTKKIDTFTAGLDRMEREIKLLKKLTK